jgi:hypothetical protein
LTRGIRNHHFTEVFEMTELGRIERPEAQPFAGQKRLYLVPLVYSPMRPQAEYSAILTRYWFGVREHLRRLEDRLGPVNKVLHESVPVGGDEGLKIIDQINPNSAAIAREKVANGAELSPIEDADLLAESMDWQRCLMVGLASQKVATQVWALYRDANKKRNEGIQQRLTEVLADGESAVLFVVEEHSLQFPPGVQVFYVAPPALDDVHRWLRDHSGTAGEDAGEAGVAGESGG